MIEHLNDPDADLEEAHAREALIYELSVALMRLDGNDGDPHQLVWERGPIPEPWGDVWQKYEPQAEEVLNAIGEGSARALVDLRCTLTNVQRVLEAAGHDAKGDDAACKALRFIAACGVSAQPQPTEGVTEDAAVRAWMGGASIEEAKALPTTCPHGTPHRWPCEQCDAYGAPAHQTPSAQPQPSDQGEKRE